MTETRRIAIVPGDGIGQEVIPEGRLLLEDLSKKRGLGLEFVDKDWGAERYLETGRGMPEDALDDLRANYAAVFFGALGDPRIPDMAHGREILLGMRFGLDLYANVRPAKALVAELCPLAGKGPDEVDFVVVRENTEDLYVSIGGRFKEGTPDEVAVDQSMNTRKGVERVVRYAFELARSTKRRRVTMADKSNAVRFGGALWQEVFASVGSEYPDLEQDHLFVDVAAMELVRAPERFDVIVTNNLFGDILSDLGAALVGSLGLAASANIHPGQIGLFEPVHGSAPDIVGQGVANPLATFLTAAMLLDHLGHSEEARAVERAVEDAVKAGETTPDLGGTGTTASVGERVRSRVAELLES